MSSPYISVLMSVYNGEEFLAEAIESILGQTFSDFEFLIIDDCSTDSSSAILKQYSEKDQRIRVIRNKKNLGLTKSLNIGLKECTGKYIARMDADDISLPERLEKQVEFMKEHLEVDAIFSVVTIINSLGEKKCEWPADINAIKLGDIQKILPEENCLAHPTLMIRTKIMRKYMYDEKIIKAQDYHLWLRMIADQCIIYKIAEPLLMYRTHKSSITSSSNDITNGLKKNINVKFNLIVSKLFWSRKIDRFRLKILRCLVMDMYSLTKFRILRFLRLFIRKLFILLGSILAKTVIADNYDLFFFFPFYHVGGGEKVHLDITSTIKTRQSAIIFTNSSRNNFFYNEFKRNGNVYDHSVMEKCSLIKFILIGYWTSLINRTNNKIVFGCNTTFFYELLPYLKPTIKKVDLTHAFGGGIEIFSVDYINYLNKRLVINQQTLNDYIEQYKNNEINEYYLDRFCLIENGVRLPRSFPPKTHSPINILYVGRNTPEKRVQLVGKVAKKCYDLSLDSTFTLIGDVKKCINEEEWLFCEFVDETKDLTNYYQKADVILITSIREGFPMVVMEAMAYGVIPICTNVGGIKYHIKHNENGFLINMTAENDIVEDIVSFISSLDVIMRQRVSRNAFEYASEHFSIERFTKQYNELFSELYEV